MRRLLGATLVACLCFLISPIKGQETEKAKDLKEKVKDAVKDADKPKEKKEGSVILNLSVPKDCKITVNEKAITYEKFEVLMEYTINAFVIEDIAYRNGQFTALKLRSRE